MNAERGSVTVFTTVITFALLLCAGLMVDCGAKIQAYRQAYAAAEEAARAGAGQMNTGHAYTSGRFEIDPTQARNAARAYLTTAGHTGTVSTTGNQVNVTVTVSKTHRADLPHRHHRRNRHSRRHHANVPRHRTRTNMTMYGLRHPLLARTAAGAALVGLLAGIPAILLIFFCPSACPPSTTWPLPANPSSSRHCCSPQSGPAGPCSPSPSRWNS
ncbi:hypothetical protein GCM10022224_094880 [Nonomuraea antimicrobica]|uniref:Putative Flp pilus-assembly TadG-like N-terminal domain-containing protein n=1 Tax=Nonomuraea antimicrobica TaxID=561173 RepID=A0ABP7E4N7_9ACTN